MIDELIKQYQESITAVVERRRQLQREYGDTYGAKSVVLEKRINVLYAEQWELEYALRGLIKQREDT